MEKYTNDLIKESSPYLQQHAHNPVNWVPWSPEVFERAKKEDKLVLISVGYSACHWCHVMEHESFEDEEVAAIMNKHFISVKVDREERPDVDQVYMTAVQLMTQQGGWPLNCFTTPDGRPIHGGTYFPKEQWMHILRSLNHMYTNDRAKVEEFAANVHEGVVASELIAEPAQMDGFEKEKLDELIRRWSKSFDRQEGGNSRAPKFPLPTNIDFLLDYGLRTSDESLLKHVELTLDKMALGGIYDQIGGGFARYSVDMLWKVPHFEKMLYDNGQLLSSYSKAYKTYPKPLYKRIVEDTVHWLEREMSDESGAFYAALDADSEGVEGKFYVWKEDELKSVLEKDFEWVKDFYNINQRGHWEDGNFILLRSESDASFAQKMNWSQDELESNVHRVNQLLLDARKDRVRPGTDDKCLTSWNAMAISGLCDAYEAFGEDNYLFLALRVAKWIKNQQLQKDGSLNRNFKNGKSTVKAFLEDYAHVIDSFTHLYRVTQDEEWLNLAKQLTEYTIEHFHDAASQMFYFTDVNTELIARKMELNDNVVPASNSVMAKNLHVLGTYYRNEEWVTISKQMLANVYDGMEMYGSGYSNWALLLSRFVFGYNEVLISGPTAKKSALELMRHESPEYLIATLNKNSEIPLLEHKKMESVDTFFVCEFGACQLPTVEIDEALRQLFNAQHG